MKCIFNKTLQFIYLKRKQILFALFALLCSILDKDIGVLKCAAPAVVAAAATAGGTAATGTTAAAGTVAASGASAGAAGASSAAAGTTTVSASAGAAGASTGAVNGSVNVGTNVNNINSKPANPNISVPKNTNPKGTHSNSLSSSSVTSDLSKPVEGMNEATNKAAKKEASVTDLEKETKKLKKNRMNPELNNDSEEDEENIIITEEASGSILKNYGGLVVGCGFISIFVLIFSIPILLLLLTMPTSSTMSQIDCTKSDGINCTIEDDSGSLLNKLKNLFAYGSFASNSGVVIDKINEVYDKIYEEENFAINLPLLSSSLFSDAEYSKSELDSNNEIVITDKMLERLEYLEELARLQMIEDYVIYTCNVKNVEGQNIYYKETNYDDIDPATVEEGECDAYTVGMIFKEKLIQYNEEEYFIRLEDSEVLDNVYSDFIESDSLLVSKIKNQYHLFNSLNLIDVEDETYAPVPMELIYDSNVNLQAPLKWWYSITSPFGMREGEFAGMHKGIDLVANDKNIYAAGRGIVTRSNVEREGGNVIEITHTASDGREYVSQYAHLSQRLVSEGDVVNSGDIIGIMGDTGTLASGVHLHFQMWVKEPYELLNPKILFDNGSN